MILLLLACGRDNATTAGTVDFDASRSGAGATTVQGALDELYIKCARAPETEAAPVVASAEVNELAGRVQALELRMATVEGNLPGPLEGEPMTASELQRAVADLARRVGQIETAASTASMGSPGSGLFEIKDTKKGKAEGPPPGGGGPGGGQGGPGGKPSGPPPQGTPPGGGGPGGR